MKGFKMIAGNREKSNNTPTDTKTVTAQEHPSRWSQMTEDQKEKVIHELMQECFARGNDTNYLTEEIGKLLQNN